MDFWQDIAIDYRAYSSESDDPLRYNTAVKKDKTLYIPLEAAYKHERPSTLYSPNRWKIWSASFCPCDEVTRIRGYISYPRGAGTGKVTHDVALHRAWILLPVSLYTRYTLYVMSYATLGVTHLYGYSSPHTIWMGYSMRLRHATAAFCVLALLHKGCTCCVHRRRSRRSLPVTFAYYSLL